MVSLACFLPSRVGFSCTATITKSTWEGNGHCSSLVSLRKSASSKPKNLFWTNNKLHLGKYSQAPAAAAASQVELSKDHELAPGSSSIIILEEDDKIERLIREIKEKFHAMNDGETSPSAYDSAWVARIPSHDDPNKPHFPMCVDWILKNQLDDGSWGEPSFFLIYDRLLNTLACVLALKTWKIGEDQINRGLKFLQDNAKFLEKESSNLTTCGFELQFPSMLNEAMALELDLPYDLPFLQDIIKLREKKIKRIPLEVMHSMHTTLLYSLEALQEVVQWEKILNLQSRDGSFLSSPSSTAMAYMKTGDKNCLEYLTYIVTRFGDNAPAQYPIDLFERIWAIDTIQRLGIDHHFQKEICDALDYVYKYAGKQGISWGRDNTIADIDDTCMALRLLRLHGYSVSSDVLEYFRDEDENFICFVGQTHRGVSDMFNLYRYSQVAFPGEKILKEAKAFVEDYLRTCIANNQVNDKWSLKKALDKEVDRALQVPWRVSFERLETREYIDQYGENDVWIAKTVYWMYNVNDPRYLELAKLDYNRLQKLYKSEIDLILKWWNGCGLDDHLVANICPKEIHFAIAATLYEPQFSDSRIAYTKCSCIENALRTLFEFHESTEELRAMCQAVEKWDPSLVHSLPLAIKTTFIALYDTLNDLAAQASNVQGKDMFKYLHDLRSRQMQHYMNTRDQEGVLPKITSLKEYIEQGKGALGVAIRLLPAMFIMGERLSNYAFGCLDDQSAIQEHLSSFLSLFSDVEKYKNSSNKDCDRDAVYFYMKEKNCADQQEAVSYLNATIEDTFDELVHECLKPSLVPRSCRRLMFEHARMTQFFLTLELRDESVRREAIDDAMNRMFTPV